MFHCIFGRYCRNVLSQFFRILPQIQIINLPRCRLPIAFYSSKCWFTIKDNELHLAVMKTKMFCWTSTIIHRDHIRNVENINRERHFRWYGQVICADANTLAIWASKSMRKDQKAEQSNGGLRRCMMTLEPHNYMQNRPLTEKNGTIDQDQPTSLLYGTKAEEVGE